APQLGCGRREVSSRAEVERVPEGEQSGVSEQQIESAGEEGKAERLHQEDRIDDRRRSEDQRDQDRGWHTLRLGARLDPLDLFRCDGGRAHACFPTSPAGRTRRTSAITTKMTVFDASG